LQRRVFERTPSQKVALRLFVDFDFPFVAPASRRFEGPAIEVALVWLDVFQEADKLGEVPHLATKLKDLFG
jgi:hypothetical protein